MKNAFKKIGKIIGRVLLAVIGILAVLCVVTLCWGAVQRSRGTVTESLPKAPADFQPAMRLIVFTDTHNENENIADAAETAYRLFDNDPVYQGVDAFYCLGDFTSIGTEGDYENYAKTLRASVREETPCVTLLGNHELKNKAEYNDLFKKYFGYEPNNVREINGFSCIAFSGERSLTEWTFTPKSLKWFSDAVKKAEKKADGKPVFVFQHPHPWGTVYGSTVWGDPQINVVLNGHANVVDFSGHSHFPLNDPRSINQASYTAVGCGAMARFELDNNGLVGQHPEGYEEAAQICVVEADADGSVRLRGYDLLSDTWICDYYIDNVNEKSTFAYTYKNMKAHDQAPVFPENTTARAQKNEAGEWRLSFDAAKVPDGFIVHEYKIVIRDETGKKIFSRNFINDYYLIGGSDAAEFGIGGVMLESGKKYTAIVRAESAYHLHSGRAELSFTAE